MEDQITELSPQQQELQFVWDKTRTELSSVTDRLGMPIDEGIKDAVTAFQANGFPTDSSCEGHLRVYDGKLDKNPPYIRVGHDEPRQRFIEEPGILESIARRFNIPIGEITQNEAAEKLYWDYITKYNAPETPEYKAQREKNLQLEKTFQTLLDSFYKNRKSPHKIKLVIQRIGPAGHFNVTTNGIEDKEIDQNDKVSLQQTLLQEQEEMQTFSQFLKDRFFSG